MGAASYIILAFELIIIGIVVIISMRQFISFKITPFYASFTSWLGWFLCFSIVFLVPVDILATDHTNCLERHNSTEQSMETHCNEPITFVNESVMIFQWQILYWGTFVLSWVIFPIFQTFATTGDFRFQERISRSIKDNLILYIFMAIAGFIFVIGLLIAKHLTISSLLSLIMLLVNGYGAVLIVLTLGYGLVDVPRNLLRKSNPYKTLRHYRVQAVVLQIELEQSRNQLIEHLRLIKTTSDRTGDYDPYRPYLDIIISKCPLEYDSIIENDSKYSSTQVPSGSEELLTYDTLVSMHTKLLDYTDQAQRSEILYDRLLGKAFATEDIIEVDQIPKDQRVPRMKWSFKSPSRYEKIEYYWYVYVYPNYYKILGLLCCIMSMLIVWSEITLPFSTETKMFSPFALIINSSKDSLSGVWLQIFCFIPLLYMAVCSYTTLFKVRIFNYYRLVPQQQTNPMSIMFSANYLCRLAAPLSYNFLQICNLVDASFTQVMGEMDPFKLGNKFILFFPFFVAFICIAALFNIHSRIAACCCISSMKTVTDTSDSAAEHGLKILKQVREERAATGGVPPPKSRFTMIRDMIIPKNKDKHNKLNNQDGADQQLPNPNRYKPPPKPKQVKSIPKLSRDYTSKSGTVYSNGNNTNNNNNNNNSYSNINQNNNNSGHAILNIGSPGKSSSKSSDKKGLLSSYWDDLSSKYGEDVEMGNIKTKK